MIQTDTDTIDTLLSHLSIDRKGPQPIHVQLRSAIEVAIFSGGIADRSRLPSIRKLASEIGVAPNTVVRVYQDLERDGWISSTPKRAYYVSLGQDDPSPVEQTRPAKLDEMVDRTLKVAGEAGFDTTQLVRLIIDRARSAAARVQKVAVVGLKQAFLDERVQIVAEATSDLQTEVVGLSYEELQEHSADTIAELDDIDYFVVPVGEVEQAAELLGENAGRILPMTRTLPVEVQEFLRSQPRSTVFGAISGNPDHISRVVVAIHRFHPLEIPPLTASIDNPDAVREVADSADVLVVGTRARSFVDALGSLDKPRINLSYVPDERTLQTLRRRLTAE